MSADELRKAAETERAEWGGEQNARQCPTASAIHLALADWLEGMSSGHVSHLRGLAGCRECTMENPNGRGHCPLCDALSVARLINGGAS